MRLRLTNLIATTLRFHLRRLLNPPPAGWKGETGVQLMTERIKQTNSSSSNSMVKVPPSRRTRYYSVQLPPNTSRLIHHSSTFCEPPLLPLPFDCIANNHFSLNDFYLVMKASNPLMSRISFLPYDEELGLECTSLLKWWSQTWIRNFPVCV